MRPTKTIVKVEIDRKDARVMVRYCVEFTTMVPPRLVWLFYDEMLLGEKVTGGGLKMNCARFDFKRGLLSSSLLPILVCGFAVALNWQPVSRATKRVEKEFALGSFLSGMQE